MRWLRGALATNPELLGANIQVIQAQAREQQARAGMLPSITAPIRAVEQKSGVTGPTRRIRLTTASGWVLSSNVWESKAPWQRRQSCRCSAIHDKENLQRLLVGA